MKVRFGDPVDLDVILAVNRAAATRAYARIFGDLPYPEERVQARCQRLLDEADVAVFVAEESGKAVGYAAARPGHLEALYVVPERWGTEVAGLLYERAADIRPAGNALGASRQSDVASDLTIGADVPNAAGLY
jgi:GNAT superfamily N-acetyltransferase